MDPHDDDDAPEEITLSSGKASAEEKRRIESQSKAAEAKKLRSKRAEAHEKNKEQQEKKAGRQTMAAAAAAAAGAAAEEEEAEEVDFLDPEILTALQSRKRGEPSTSGQAPLKIDVQKRAKATIKKQTLLAKGPVVVEILNPKKKLTGTGADGNSFMRDKLYGSGSRKRSYDMLRAASASKTGPAAKFV